ncbi:MAG: hypothetical protein ACFWUE_08015 [Xylanivirga thermophila]|jgi:hypothetical protein
MIFLERSGNVYLVLKWWCLSLDTTILIIRLRFRESVRRVNLILRPKILLFQESKLHPSKQGFKILTIEKKIDIFLYGKFSKRTYI